MKSIVFQLFIFQLLCFYCSSASDETQQFISKDFFKNLYASGVEQTTEAPAVNENEAYIEENPGLRIRITQNGFDYLNNFVLDIVSDAIMSLKIPDIESSSVGFEMKIFNINVTNFPRPVSHFEIKEGQGVVYNITHVQPDILADYVATVGFGYWQTTNYGQVKITGRVISFEMDFAIELGENGKPKLILTECKNKGHIGMYYEGGWSEALSIGSTFLKTKLRMVILSQICFQAKNAVNNQLAKMLENHEMIYLYEDVLKGMKLGPYEIHYGLTSKPEVHEKAVDLNHKAMIYYLKNNEKVYPANAELLPLPTFPNHTEKMAYLYITEPTINSVLHAVYANGLIKYNVTYANMPKSYRYILATSCNSFFQIQICIGTLFPQLRRLYPRSKAWISLKASNAPTVQLRQREVEFNAGFYMDIMVEHRRKSHHVVTVQGNISLTVEFNMVDNTLYFEVINSTYATRVVNASLDKFSDDHFFDTLMGIGVDSITIPLINDQGEEGYKLPEYPELQFVNPEIFTKNITDGVLILATDFIAKMPKLDLDFNIDSDM